MTHSSRRLKIVRSESDYALAARMLLRLKNGADLRSDRVARARKQLHAGLLDDAARLERAIDILIDELMAESARNLWSRRCRGIRHVHPPEASA
jgi:hypothetical protein